MIEKTIDSRVLHKGLFLDFVEHDIEIENTEPLIKSKRQFFLHPGGVCVVPILDNDKIVLVRQFRKAVEKTLLEIPAGKIDPGETENIATAKRELREETGYTAKTWVDLGEIVACPGYCSEILYMFLAKDLIPGEQDLDHGEVVEKVILPIQEAKEMVFKGEITDAKTISALLLCEQHI